MRAITGFRHSFLITAMDLSKLVTAIELVELTAKTRTAAIRSLVLATGLDEEGIALGDVLEAIEEREATAQTIVEEGFALPHALCASVYMRGACQHRRCQLSVMISNSM